MATDATVTPPTADTGNSFFGGFISLGENFVKAAQGFSPADMLAESTQDMSPTDRYEALKKGATAFGQGDAFEALDKAPQNVRESFGNAYVFNEDFRDYVANQTTDGANLKSIIGKLDGQTSGPVSDILNRIANKDGYTSAEDFEKLDGVLSASDNHAKLVAERAQKLKADPKANTEELNEQIALAQTELINAVKNAGGNVPAFAGMDGAMMMAFMSDMLGPVGVEGAIDNLGAALNMSPEELAALQETLGPMMEIITFAIKPYAELYQKHGDRAVAYGKEMKSNFDVLAGNDRVKFEADATRDGVTTSETPKGTVKAEFSDSVRKTVEEIKTAALEGAELAKTQGRLNSFTPALS